jgi:hypothetical protein
MVDSLKVLDPERPIREADIARGRFRGQQQTLASFSNLVDDSK